MSSEALTEWNISTAYAALTRWPRIGKKRRPWTIRGTIPKSAHAWINSSLYFVWHAAHFWCLIYRNNAVADLEQEVTSVATPFRWILNLQLSIHDMPNSKESIFYMYVDYICHFYVTVIILYVCITGVTSAQLSWETTSMPWEGMTVRWDRILLNGTFQPKTSGASFHQCNTVEAMPAPPHLTVNINFDLHQLFLSIHLCPIFKSCVLKNPNTGRGSSTAERSLLMTGRSWVRTPLVSNLRHWKGY